MNKCAYYLYHNLDAGKLDTHDKQTRGAALTLRSRALTELLANGASDHHLLTTYLYEILYVCTLA